MMECSGSAFHVGVRWRRRGRAGNRFWISMCAGAAISGALCLSESSVTFGALAVPGLEGWTFPVRMVPR